MNMTRVLSAVLLVAAGVIAPGLAMAQYQWVDDNGRMVFSDRPPPASVAPSKVKVIPVKAPTKPAEKAAEVDAKPLANQVATNSPSPAAPKSTADKDLEAKKRALDAEEAAKKQKAEAERQTKMAAACTDTSSGIRSLESGTRIATTNVKGEREFLGDEEKSKRLNDLKKDFAENCATKAR
jgi:hypothetical protein